jgi:hypothetical protein
LDFREKIKHQSYLLKVNEIKDKTKAGDSLLKYEFHRYTFIPNQIGIFTLTFSNKNAKKVHLKMYENNMSYKKILDYNEQSDFIRSIHLKKGMPYRISVIADNAHLKYTLQMKH